VHSPILIFIYCAISTIQSSNCANTRNATYTDVEHASQSTRARFSCSPAIHVQIPVSINLVIGPGSHLRCTGDQVSRLITGPSPPFQSHCMEHITGTDALEPHTSINGRVDIMAPYGKPRSFFRNTGTHIAAMGPDQGTQMVCNTLICLCSTGLTGDREW